MQFQRRGPKGWCGVASVQAALRCLGIKKSQPHLASLVHMDEDGGVADEQEILRMLQAGAPAADVYSSLSADLAWLWLVGHLTHRGPVILYLASEDHYVTVIGRCGDSVVVFDPQNTTVNRREHGIRVYDRAGLVTRWGPDEFYGIGVSR